MYGLRKCKLSSCDVIFEQKTYHHKFCSRECFRKWHYRKKKKFPEYRCNNCGEITQLDFFPIKKYHRLMHFECPKCGKKPHA